MPVMRAWDGTQWVSLPAAAPNPGAVAQAVNVNFAPAGNISSTNVQAAIEEVETDYIAADTLKVSTATLALSTGSSLVGHTQGGAGATTTTVQNKLRRYVDVKDFGATGNGSTDDTAAIQAALDQFNNIGPGEVYFPPGTYVTSSPLIINNCAIHIRGAGQGASTIRSSVSSNNIIFVSQDSFLHYTTIEGLTIRTSQVDTAIGIHVQFSEADATNNRTTDRVILRDLQLIPTTFGTHGWNRGIVLLNCHAATVENVNIMGRAYAAGMEAGIIMFNTGTGAPADITLRNVKAYYGVTGFKGTGHLEGVNISQCFAIAVQVGFDFRLSSDFPWFSLTHSHANVTSQGVHLENFSQSFIDHNLIYIVNHGAGSTPVGISLKACNDTIVDSNNIVNPVALGGTTVVGIFTENCLRNKVANNKVAGYNVAYWLAGTTDFQRTYDNETSSGYGGSIKYNMAASGGSNVQRDTA